MSQISAAQVSKLRMEAHRRGFASAEEAAIAAGVPTKKGRLDVRFDLDSVQASSVITQLVEGTLRPASDADADAIDLSAIPTDALLAEIARRSR